MWRTGDTGTIPPASLGARGARWDGEYSTEMWPWPAARGRGPAPAAGSVAVVSLQAGWTLQPLGLAALGQHQTRLMSARWQEEWDLVDPQPRSLSAEGKAFRGRGSVQRLRALEEQAEAAAGRGSEVAAVAQHAPGTPSGLSGRRGTVSAGSGTGRPR